MNKSLSASGARIRGDEYQHLVALIQIVFAFLPESKVERLGLEDPDAGNADDVTVYRIGGRCDFYQVKSRVDGSRPCNLDWLTSPSSSGGDSILKGLYKVWTKYRGTDKDVVITLYSNGLPDPNDSFMSARDGRNGTVAVRLFGAKTSSAAKRQVDELCEHLSLKTDELRTFLESLSLRLGKSYEELHQDARLAMFAAGLRYDDDAVAQGEQLIRKLVTDGVRSLNRDQIAEKLETFKRDRGLPKATLLVQAIDRLSSPETATIVLDWVDEYVGEEARTRRVLKDNENWNKKLRPDIQEAAASFQKMGATSVLVRGFARLPTWFTVGTALARTAGFSEVVAFQGNDPWSSEGSLSEYGIEVLTETYNQAGEDLAVCVAVSMDPSDEVRKFIQSRLPTISRFVRILPKRGVSNTAFRSDAQVRRWAYSVRDAIRQVASEQSAAILHLFLATPHGASLILGHHWDRMPSTQTYEDGGQGRGYVGSFFIPN